MGDSLEIWTVFAKTTGMLFVVIAVLLLVLYLVKRLSAIKSGKNSQDLIRVLSVHYLSPKAKVVLLDVMHEKILIGVTTAKITSLATIQSNPDTDKSNPDTDKSYPDIDKSNPDIDKGYPDIDKGYPDDGKNNLNREIENRPGKVDFKNLLNDKLAGTFLKKTPKNKIHKGEEDGQ
ncbi:MAG: flagellar biosynthetic protein FliO [Thermodesulfobacteriota bacterium]|nr:flagellar biosynthetic protein FliO [Thermodesulfobacteriota bacterium]